MFVHVEEVPDNQTETERVDSSMLKRLYLES